MSYRLDLDEIPAARLEGELQRRTKLRSEGKCDYCERHHNVVPACKFPERHMGKDTL